jgi:hypothetical protein
VLSVSVSSGAIFEESFIPEPMKITRSMEAHNPFPHKNGEK